MVKDVMLTQSVTNYLWISFIRQPILYQLNLFKYADFYQRLLVRKSIKNVIRPIIRLENKLSIFTVRSPVT